MISGYHHVNGYEVVAELQDMTVKTGQSIVVCRKPRSEDFNEYVVWAVAQVSGKTEAWYGYYTPNLADALSNAGNRAWGA